MRKKTPREVYRDFKRKQIEELYTDEGYAKRKAAIEKDKRIREYLKKSREHQEKKELLRKTKWTKATRKRERYIDKMLAKLKPNLLVVHRQQAGIVIKTEVRERKLSRWDYEQGYEYAEWAAARARELWVYTYLQNEKRRRWVNAEELEIPDV